MKDVNLGSLLYTNHYEASLEPNMKDSFFHVVPAS